MEHSDELTFAEYFKSRYDLFRGLITFVVAMQWLIDHDFAEPTDRDARLMDIEVSRQMCDVWGELYVLTLREWLDGNNSGPPADCDVLLDMTGSFFVPKTTSQSEFMEVNVWNFSILLLTLYRLS